MFALRTARFLKAMVRAAWPCWLLRHTAEIASVHQYGEVDNVVPGARALPARNSGMTEGDLDWLADTVVTSTCEILIVTNPPQ